MEESIVLIVLFFTALAVMYGVNSIPGQLAAAGAVCYALVIIIGVPACVRINHQIVSWSIQHPPRNGPKSARDGYGSMPFELYSPCPHLPFMFLPRCQADNCAQFRSIDAVEQPSTMLSTC